MLIFLDFETTGLEPSDKIVAVGMIVQDEENFTCRYELVNEQKKIPPAASAIHHITNEMIVGKPKFRESEAYKEILSLNSHANTLISHNASFELALLEREGILWQGEVIDTLRVSRHLMDDLEGYSLQLLRYELKLYKEESKALLACEKGQTMQPHHALCDALLVKLLYNYLLELSSHAKLCELSHAEVLLKRLEFGKYSGRFIEEILSIDPGYLRWMAANITDMSDDLRYTLRYYLGD